MSRGRAAILVALATLLAAALADARHAPRRLPPNEIDGRQGPKHRVAFTFDDGPSHATTPRILDTLDAWQVRAAFFVNGYHFAGTRRGAAENRAVLADELARGHKVGNHGFGHRNLSTLRAKAAIAQIRLNDQAIQRATGSSTNLFRPPYGALTAATTKYLEDTGYTIVGWDIDALDFAAKDPKKLAARIVAQIVRKDGGIVILHDIKPDTVKALPLILAGLERENCRRLARHEEPILPVELDYFETGPIPADVDARTKATEARLISRCKKLK